MEQYRNTYMKVSLSNIEDNVRTIISTYSGYQYYFGVVKADSYGHCDNEVVNSIVKGGCNYLAVSSLEEALQIRKELKEISILCLGVILPQYLSVCIENKITITILSLEYGESIPKELLSNLVCHIKIDTGMNRLGLKSSKEIKKLYDYLKESSCKIEGIYTHIYEASNKEKTEKQFHKFLELTREIPLEEIPIVHIAQSETVVSFSKLPFVNGCRLGIVMYGITPSSIPLKSTFSLISQIIEIKDLKKGETVGYNSIYTAEEDEKIGIVAIGYADGIIRKNTGRDVFIHGKRYPIIGNICMDMLMVKIDDTVKLYDEVEIIKDKEHLIEISKYLETIPYEVMCNITKRVPRKYEKTS